VSTVLPLWDGPEIIMLVGVLKGISAIVNRQFKNEHRIENVFVYMDMLDMGKMKSNISTHNKIGGMCKIKIHSLLKKT